MDYLNTRMSLYDVYPNFEMMKELPAVEQSSASVATPENEKANWGLILLLIAAVVGAGAYCGVKWWEEEQKKKLQ